MNGLRDRQHVLLDTPGGHFNVVAQVRTLITGGGLVFIAALGGNPAWWLLSLLLAVVHLLGLRNLLAAGPVQTDEIWAWLEDKQQQEIKPGHFADYAVQEAQLSRLLVWTVLRVATIGLIAASIVVPPPAVLGSNAALHLASVMLYVVVAVKYQPFRIHELDKDDEILLTDQAKEALGIS